MAGSEVTTMQVRSLIDGVISSPLAKSFLAGSLSGTCSTILFQPLDLVKTRLQTSVKKPKAGSESNGMLTILRCVVQKERIFGLWKGMTPSMLRCVPGVGLYFTSIHWLKQSFCDGPPGALQAVALGVMARTVTGVTTIPFTVIKTRYESDVYGYRNLGDAVKAIYHREGPRGLTCGLIPTLLRDAPFSGLYLLFYTQTKRTIPQNYFETNYAPALCFGSGIFAGLLASAATQPFDVVKTKMQLYPDKFNGLGQAVLFVHHKYGAMGFFKGLAPRVMRRTLMAAMAWTVYDQMMVMFGLNR